MSEPDDDDIAEALEEAKAARKIAQTALQEKSALEDHVDDLEAEIERLEYRVAELEVATPDETTDYSELSQDEKIGRVRQELMQRANAAPSGKAQIEYKDVLWSVFDGEPSAGHVYNLMKSAGRADGFEYADPTDGNKRVTVDVDAVKDEAAFSPVNKDEAREDA